MKVPAMSANFVKAPFLPNGRPSAEAITTKGTDVVASSEDDPDLYLWECIHYGYFKEGRGMDSKGWSMSGMQNFVSDPKGWRQRMLDRGFGHPMTSRFPSRSKQEAAIARSARLAWGAGKTPGDRWGPRGGKATAGLLGETHEARRPFSKKPTGSIACQTDWSWCGKIMKLSKAEIKEAFAERRRLYMHGRRAAGIERSALLLAQQCIARASAAVDSAIGSELMKKKEAKANPKANPKTQAAKPKTQAATKGKAKAKAKPKTQAKAKPKTQAATKGKLLGEKRRRARRASLRGK